MQYEMADGQPPLQMPVIAGRVVSHRVVVAVVCILHGCRHIVGRTELLITASRCDQHGHKAGGSNNNILTKKREGKQNSNSATYHDLKKQKVTDCLLYMF